MSDPVALISLWLPILLTTVALFFTGFLCWTVFPNHKPDWKKLPNEAAFLDKIAEMDIPPGNYAYPHAMDSKSTETEDYKRAVERKTFGTIQAWGGAPQMGPKLACQVVYLLVTSICLAYLGKLGLNAGSDFMTVFRFMTTAAFLAFTVAVVPSTIWFNNRLTGYLIDGVIQSIIVGAIFGALWPAGTVG